MRIIHGIKAVEIAVCLMFMAAVLVSCQPAGSENGRERSAERAGSVSAKQTAEEKTTEFEAADSKSVPASGREAAPVILDQWQMVTGYGICKKGEPAVYVMDPEASRLRTDTKGVSARLLSAVYQDNVLSIKVKIRDDTVTLIPEAEVGQLLPQEQDDSYFTIDSERKIYGRSGFRTMLKEKKEEQKAGGVRSVTFDRINGKGIDGLGFKEQQNRITFSDNGKGGYYCSTISEKTIGKGRFVLDEPEGVYELYLDGFQEPMEIVFQRARSYDSLEDMDGMVSHGGFYGAAEGLVEEDGLRLTTYTYAREGYRFGFVRGQLMCTLSNGKTVELVPAVGEAMTTGLDLLSGIRPRSIQETLYKIPEGFEVSEASLHAEKPFVISREASQVLELPVPEGEEPLDRVIKFRECNIYLTGIRTLEELYDCGTDENGQPVKKHMVYIDARAEMKEADMNFYYVSALQPEKEGVTEKEGMNAPESSGKEVSAIVDMERGDGESPGDLKGITALYDEGGSVIRLKLQNPSYWWNQEFVLPVQM